MKIFKVLSLLLSYPENELKESLSEIKVILQELSIDGLDNLLNYFDKNNLISLQENYVKTFDRNYNHSLHLFEHIYGEDRARGQAMIDLLEEYKSQGFDLEVSELPDYLPAFLELLSLLEKKRALELLADAIDVIAHIGKKLNQYGSVYSDIFDLLIELCKVKPKPLKVAPVRTMEEAMEKFGPNTEGMELLINQNFSMDTQVVNFYKDIKKNNK